MSLKRVCAWCKEVMDEGDPGEDVTHGICDKCFEIQKKEIAAEWRKRGVEIASDCKGDGDA